MGLKGTKTEQNLKDAFAGESQANRRYLYFANKADVEGQNDVAALFRSTAEGETGHAHGHLEFLENGSGDPATGLPIGSSRQNLMAGVAYVPETMGIFSDLTVQENMVLAARAARHAGELDKARLDWIFGLFPALKKFWLYPAGKLSGGQKQMLAVARAIVEPRALILIDEPSKGLAPSIIQNLISAFRELKAQQTTILLVEQNFLMARALGDRVAVMDDGRVVHSGDMAELAADEGLQQRLLGLSLGAHQ